MEARGSKKELAKKERLANGSPLVKGKKKSDLTAASDEELVQGFQKGDEDAFYILFGRHEKPVFNFLLKYMGNREAAEEAFQEVFLRVIKFIGDYRPSAKFTTWLYTIARNLTIDYSRKEKFRRHSSLDETASGDAALEWEPVSANVEAADDATVAGELKERLQGILKGLNPEQREVFLLRQTQGLAFDEIAKITGTSVNTVKSRMRYAMQAIQKQFRKLGVTGT